MPYVEASVRSRQFVAARTVMARDGVAAMTLRAVAAEVEVSLGTLRYAFPSKELLLRAVIEDVVDEIARVLTNSVQVDRGLAYAIRQGLTTFWSQLVADQINLQIMQGELLNYALRQPGHEGTARWQYERYVGVIADGCRDDVRRGVRGVVRQAGVGDARCSRRTHPAICCRSRGRASARRPRQTTAGLLPVSATPVGDVHWAGSETAMTTPGISTGRSNPVSGPLPR